MSCKNICERIGVKSNGRISEYIAGKRFCKACHCFFVTVKYFCECCGKALRTRPRDTKAKERILKLERQIFRRKRSKLIYWLKNKGNPEFQEHRRALRKEYNQKHKERRKQTHNNWNRNHKELVAKYSSKYYQKNKERLKQKERERYAARRRVQQLTIAKV